MSLPTILHILLDTLLFPGESLQDCQTQVLTGFSGHTLYILLWCSNHHIYNTLILVILALLLFIWLQKIGTFSVLLSAVFPALGSHHVCLVNICWISDGIVCINHAYLICIHVAFSLLLLFIENIFQSSSCGALKMTTYLLFAHIQKDLMPGYPDVILGFFSFFPACEWQLLFCYFPGL